MFVLRPHIQPKATPFMVRHRPMNESWGSTLREGLIDAIIVLPDILTVFRLDELLSWLT